MPCKLCLLPTPPPQAGEGAGRTRGIAVLHSTAHHFTRPRICAARAVTAAGVRDTSSTNFAYSGAGHRLDPDIDFVGIGQERWILHRLVETIAQRLHAVRRRTGRRRDRPLEIEPAEHQREQLPVSVALGIIEDERHLGHGGILRQSDLYQDVGLVGREQPRGAHGVVADAAEAFDLAALHREP